MNWPQRRHMNSAMFYSSLQDLDIELHEKIQCLKSLFQMLRS